MARKPATQGASTGAVAPAASDVRRPRLTILVWDEWLDKPAVKALAATHDVQALGAADIIVHPGAYRWHDRPDWWASLGEVVKDAKKRRKAEA